MNSYSFAGSGREGGPARQTLDKQLKRWITYGFLTSLVIHSILFFFLQYRFEFPESAPVSYDVSFIPVPIPQSKNRRQIVTEPQSRETTTAPPDARFEADKNRVTEREQIRRGLSPEAGPVVGKQAPSSPPSQERQAPKVETPRQPTSRPPQTSPSTRQKRITSLRLSPDNLQGTFRAPQQQKDMGPAARELLSAPPSLSQYRPFSRPTGSGARFLGSTGSADYLPNLPDGDITLLNAKANKFAVFVRRVATRVFSKLRASGWETLSRSDIARMRDFSTVRAVLSPSGKLLKVQLEGPSGSRNFDDVVSIAAESGASDPHPPPGARAADGNIHFLFKARSWSQIGPSRGGKGVAEQRWLLLATGLE